MLWEMNLITINIILRNVIINQDAAKVDNHISTNDIFDYHPLKNVIFIYYHTCRMGIRVCASDQKLFCSHIQNKEVDEGTDQIKLHEISVHIH